MSSRPRFIHPLLAIALVCLAGSACSVTEPSGPHSEVQARLMDAEALWRAQNLSDYSYLYSRGCFCVPEVREPATVTVRGGVVVSVVSVSTGAVRDPAAYLTVEQLFDLVQHAIDEDAATIRVEYDPARGYLTSAYFDLDERLADEEFSIEAKSLTPAR